MKTYNQFIVESDSARENIQEALPLVIPAIMGGAKIVGYGLAAYNAYQAAQKLRKGDYKGAAFDAALAIPSAGVAGRLGQAFKWGQRGKRVAANTLRTAKVGGLGASIANEVSKENQAASSTQPTQSTSSTQSVKPTQSAGTQPVKPVQPAAKPRVLSKLKGVQGTGVGKDFVAKKWTSAESDRYKRVAAQNAKKATPKPAPDVKRTNNINLP